jgi:hypothetical protein
MITDTQSERAGFAVEGAGMAVGHGNPLGGGAHTLSATFFAEGERKEAQGWDWADLAYEAPRASSVYRSFDEIPRRRLPWVAAISVVVATLLAAAAICLL